MNPGIQILEPPMVTQTVNNLPAMWERDPGLIPGLGRSPGEGNGYPLQYSCLENSKDRRAWRATDFCTDMSVTTTFGKYQERYCWVFW